MTSDTFDNKLQSWDEVRAGVDWDVLLLGNGASRAVWSKFGYTTLREVASRLTPPNHLRPYEDELFDRLGAGGNFEQVLRDLSTAITVMQAFQWNSRKVMSSYTHIREALAAAVHEVHVPYSRAQRVTERIADELSSYSHIFTLSYDFLLYWAIMNHTDSFTDCFESGEFASWMGFRSNRPHKLFYLHGALHLYDVGEGVRKDANDDGSDLLRRVEQRIAGGNGFPVFVSEGDHEKKLARIRQNPYLNFAYDMLLGNSKNIVVFGTAFGPMDSHILAAINKWPQRRVAISIFPGEETDIRQEKLRLAYSIKHNRPLFFNSLSFPLGRPDMCVDMEPEVRDESL